MSGTVPAGHDNSDGHHDTKPVSTDEQAILDIMAAIETGWETGDGELFRQNFLDWSGARYFESGGENAGLLDLVENHVEPEKDTIPDLELDFSNIDVQFEGSDFAWAVADTAISGTSVSGNKRCCSARSPAPGRSFTRTRPLVRRDKEEIQTAACWPS